MSVEPRGHFLMFLSDAQGGELEREERAAHDRVYSIKHSIIVLIVKANL